MKAAGRGKGNRGLLRNHDQETVATDPGRFYLFTFGCQMNRHDSERISGLLRARGWRRVDDEAGADLILLNTCSVRPHPEEKVWGRLSRCRRLKADQPELILGVLGCMARLREEEIRDRFPEVEIILGPEDFGRLGEELAARFVPDRTEKAGEISWLAPADRESPLSAWVTVIRGCDNFCSYCVVPYARGREASRPPEEVLAEVRGLGERGCREITLLGQNVNSYRGTGEDGGRVDFPGLLELVNSVAGIKRIRFLTSHPKDISPGLVRAVAELEKVCEFLHFPAQSGSDRVLARMRRGYTRDEYLDRVESLKSAVPGIALASDFIVGFPGETDRDFARTLDLLEEVGFDQIFAFAYSPRPGTVAANLEDDVPPRVKADRLRELLFRQRLRAEEKNRRLVGTAAEVLVEGRNPRFPDRGEGRTRTGKRVFFPWEAGLPGRLIDVRIERATALSLYGTVVSSRGGAPGLEASECLRHSLD